MATFQWLHCVVLLNKRCNVGAFSSGIFLHRYVNKISVMKPISVYHASTPVYM